MIKFLIQDVIFEDIEKVKEILTKLNLGFISIEDDNPAIIVETKDEIIKSYIKDGIFHRLYGPAIEYKINQHNNKWVVDGFLINYQNLYNWAVDNSIPLDYNLWNKIHKIKFLKKWSKNNEIKNSSIL